MAFGDLVKSLIVRFSSEGYEPVKAEIDSIPDQKTVKIKLEVDGRMFSQSLLNAVADARRRIAAESRTFDLLNPAGGGGGGIWSTLFGSLASGGLGPLPAALSSPVGLAAVAGAAGAALSEVTALVSGFAAAGTGAVAFGLLSKPTFSAISGAITQISADTLAYQRATTATAKKTDLAHIKQDWAALDPVQKQAVKQVQAFQAAWAATAQAFQPTAMKIFNDGLSILNHLLPVLTPLATAFANALDPLLKRLDTFVQSPGFKTWLGKFTSLIGPATGAIGSGIGRFASDVGKLLTTFSGKDVAHAINIAFDIIDGAVRAFTWVVNSSRTAWDWISQKAAPAVEHAFDNVQHALGNVKHAWDNVSHAIDNVRHAFGNIGHAFDNIGHAIGNFNHAIDNVRHFVAVAFIDIWHAIDTAAQKIRHFFLVDIPWWIAVGISWFNGLPSRILHAVGNLGTLLVNAGKNLIGGLINGIKSAIPGLSSVLSWVTSIIPHFKGPIEKDRMLLYPSGQAIMGGLMGGIGSQVPALTRQLGGITNGIGIAARGTGAGGGGGVTVHVTVNGFVGSELQLATQIQRSLLALKRQRGFGQGNTSAGLGLA